MRHHIHQPHARAVVRAIALAPPRQDVVAGMVASVLALATAFFVLAAGWQVGGLVLRLLSVAA